jgi:RimJ/RimL family protein N-acetyltransferase
MIISKYGINLVRVHKEHIEMIRIWRNDPKIRDHMFFKSEITADMQKNWFNSINNDQNFYFMVCPAEQPIGLISISSIDYEHNKAFAGLFIYDDNYLGTDIPVRSSLCLLDVFFSYTGVDTLYAKVRDSNIVADQYNTSLGFERIKKIELGQGYEYGLEKANYFIKSSSLRQAAMKLYGIKTTISFDNELLETNLKNRFLEALSMSSGNDQMAGESELDII